MALDSGKLSPLAKNLVVLIRDTPGGTCRMAGNYPLCCIPSVSYRPLAEVTAFPERCMVFAALN